MMMEQKKNVLYDEYGRQTISTTKIKTIIRFYPLPSADTHRKVETILFQGKYR